MKGADVVWGVAFAGLLLLGYGVIPTPDVRSPDGSLSEESAGKKAFFLVTEELLTHVSRSVDSLIPQDPQADTLVMLGPARYPDRAQWQTLYDWVSQGRALVFAARREDPVVDLEPFGIEVVPHDSDPQPPTSPQPEDTPNGIDSVLTELVDGAVEWRSGGEVRTSAEDASIELTMNGAAQVVWRPIGDGAIVVVASDAIFMNRSLVTDNHGLLAFRILETAAPAGPTYFDEFMNAAGPPRVVGILLETPFRLITLQLLMVIFLLGWIGSRRFGPVHTDFSSARRSLVEHAEALGNLHFKAGSGPRLVSSYLEFFRRDFGLRHASGGGGLEKDPAIRGKAAESSALDSALLAARATTVSRDHVGELVRSLARSRSRSERASIVAPSTPSAKTD
jgi:hypothetical protein